MRFYNPTDHGFYDSALYSDVPAEAVELTDDQYFALRRGLELGQLVFIDGNGVPQLQENPAARDTAASLCARIEAAADKARHLVAGDPLRAVEYDRAASEAHAFKLAGYPLDAVPRCVAAWAIGGRSAQEAADNIIAEATAYIEVLYRLRETRLHAKEGVRALMTAGDIAAAQLLTDETIQEIHVLITGVGNSRT